MLFTFITALIFAADQFIKYFVHKSFVPNQSIQVIDNILHLTYVQNKGAAFGLFWGSTWFLVSVGVSAIAAIIYFDEHLSKRSLLHIPLAFLLGGSLGNLFDRVFRSYVVDYIDFRVWPVFNLADIMINVGVFIIILDIFLRRNKV